MRVLFVDQFSELGGAQIVLRDVLTEAKRRDWDVEFMAPGDGPLFDYCRANKIPSHSLSGGKFHNGRKSVGDILRYGYETCRAGRKMRDGFDLVYANGPRMFPAAAFAGSPVVFHLHSYLDKRYARVIARASLRYSGATAVCVSEFVAGCLPAGSARVLYNGVADQGYRTGRGSGRVGIIGRIAKEKGHADFIRAAKLISARRRNVRFTIHGAPLFSDAGFEDELRVMATGAPVEFHGWTGDVSQVLREIDVLVAPSSHLEATPRVIMEALSAGTPVVAYRCGGIPELIRDGETGVLTERSDADALAAAIESLLDDPARADALGRNGRMEWERRFRLADFQAKICDLLERCAEQGGQAQPAAAVAGKHDFV